MKASQLSAEIHLNDPQLTAARLFLPPLGTWHRAGWYKKIVRLQISSFYGIIRQIYMGKNS